MTNLPTDSATTATASPRTSTVVAIEGFGKTRTSPGAVERPSADLHYRVLFSIAKASTPDKVNPSLDKVARFLNLLAEDGVRPQAGDVAVVIHGDATAIVMRDAAFAAKHAGAPNPSTELIRRLKQAGVSVRVCSQALAAQSVSTQQVDEAVAIDVSALTTSANLQLRGYALIAD
jgi:intracellular sulfur oxidation DsrE/DsrF family protein